MYLCMCYVCVCFRYGGILGEGPILKPLGDWGKETMLNTYRNLVGSSKPLNDIIL